MICNKCGQGVSDGVATYWRMMNFTFCPHCVDREIKRYDRDAEVPGVADRFYRYEIGRIENEVQER